MKQSALLEFESSAFAITPGEDEQTNPGIFGKALAQWLAEQLRARGFTPGQVIPEDFGWCVAVQSKPHRLYVVCASASEQENHWRVFAFAEGGLIARMLGKDRSVKSVATLFAAIKQILQSSPEVQGLCQETPVKPDPLDRRIFKTIQGHTPDNPQTLTGIIWGVDASERFILTHEELSGGLQRLISAGHIAEIKTHQFCDTSDADHPKTFSGVTQSDHKAAVAQYRKEFWELARKLDDEPGEDDFVQRKLVLRWVTPNNRWPTDEDEKAAEKLAHTIDPMITQSSLGEINGFEHGSGHIDILIFGKAIDSDVDQIYDLLAPPFRAHNCPPGSRIVRFYNKRNEELESDVVPDNAIEQGEAS